VEKLGFELGVVYSKAGGLEKFLVKSLEEIHPFREKPFFTCYLKTLDAAEMFVSVDV
jgi:hypothetical protein